MIAALNYGVVENIKTSGEVSGKENTGGIIAQNGVCAEQWLPSFKMGEQIKHKWRKRVFKGIKLIIKLDFIYKESR